MDRREAIRVVLGHALSVDTMVSTAQTGEREAIEALHALGVSDQEIDDADFGSAT